MVTFLADLGFRSEGARPTPMTSPRTFSTPQRAAFALLVALVAAITTLASAATPTELRNERKQVQEDAAELALELDALSAEVAELSAALDATQANVEAQQAAVDDAERSRQDAQLAHARARVAIRDLETSGQQARDNLRAAAVEGYVSFQGFDDIEILGDDPWTAIRAETLVDIGTGTGLEALDDMRSIGAELDYQRELAAQAAEEAAGYETDVALRLAKLDAASVIAETLLNQVLARQDHRLSEAASLATLEASLSQDIREEEQLIADIIASRVPSGSSIIVLPDANIELVKVRGITVNSLIADNLEGLLAAMEARGFTMSGGGYRSTDRQIWLRKKHCGTSDYEIREMPSNQCRPPTARPGRSQHEVGLAIDFTYNGRVIVSERTAIYKALAEIAEDYGFHNLRGEPWHWSTTGN